MVNPTTIFKLREVLEAQGIDIQEYENVSEIFDYLEVALQDPTFVLICDPDFNVYGFRSKQEGDFLLERLPEGMSKGKLAPIDYIHKRLASLNAHERVNASQVLFDQVSDKKNLFNPLVNNFEAESQLKNLIDFLQKDESFKPIIKQAPKPQPKPDKDQPSSPRMVVSPEEIFYVLEILDDLFTNLGIISSYTVDNQIVVVFNCLERTDSIAKFINGKLIDLDYACNKN